MFNYCINYILFNFNINFIIDDSIDSSDLSAKTNIFQIGLGYRF